MGVQFITPIAYDNYYAKCKLVWTILLVLETLSITFAYIYLK